jgi:hypothetical protein
MLPAARRFAGNLITLRISDHIVDSYYPADEHVQAHDRLV